MANLQPVKKIFSHNLDPYENQSREVYLHIKASILAKGIRFWTKTACGIFLVPKWW
jgi:hypothetical protein